MPTLAEFSVEQLREFIRVNGREGLRFAAFQIDAGAGSLGRWWGAPGAGYTDDRRRAHIYEGANIEYGLNGSGQTIYHVLAHPRLDVEKLPESKKCLIENVLSRSLIELLKTAPKNKVVRTQVLNSIRMPLPDEVQDYEAIKAWIESNIERRKAVFPTDDNRRVWTARMEATRMRQGTCSFDLRERWVEEETFTERQVLSVLEEFPDISSLQQLIEKLVEYRVNDVQEDPPQEFDTISEEHDSYFTDSESPLQITVDRSNAVAHLCRWVRSYHPELREILGIQ